MSQGNKACMGDPTFPTPYPFSCPYCSAYCTVLIWSFMLHHDLLPRVNESFIGLTREMLTAAGLSLPETSALLLAIKRFRGELDLSSPRTVVQRRAAKGGVSPVS